MRRNPLLATRLIALGALTAGWTACRPAPPEARSEEAAVAGVAVPTPTPSAETPNFLVVDIDTLSYDHLGTKRDGQAVTPVIDGLAARGVRFSQAISQSGWTLPAVASLLTGALPVSMKMADGGIPWQTGATDDLAEILQIHGYQTAAFWARTLPGGVSDRASRPFKRTSVNTRAAPTEEVRAWLTATPEPFFAFVHEIDLNFPLAMEGPYRFDTPDWPAGASNYVDTYLQLESSVGVERAQAAVLSHYDSVLHSYDAALGGLLQALDARGVSDRTVIVVTSNHGQDFFAHSLVNHGLVYDTNLKIPLVVVDPLSKRPGQVVEQVVQMVDIAPTILTRTGAKVAAGMVGQSLLPFLGLPDTFPATPYVERPVYSMSDDCNASLRTAAWKLIVKDCRPVRPVPVQMGVPGQPVVVERPADAVLLVDFVAQNGLAGLPLPDCSSSGHGVATGELVVELFDLLADPGERKNLVGARPAVAAEMLPTLLTTLATQKAAGTAAPREALRPEQVKQIQDQGYWGLVKPDGG